MSRVRSRLGGDGRHLEVSRRVRPKRCRGQEVMLVAGDPFRVVMPVNQGLGESGPLRAVPGRLSRMPMILQGMRSQPEPLRHSGSGKKEESGGERLAQRHARIVA